jgi:hypothetical protein
LILRNVHWVNFITNVDREFKTIRDIALEKFDLDLVSVVDEFLGKAPEFSVDIHRLAKTQRVLEGDYSRALAAVGKCEDTLTTEELQTILINADVVPADAAHELVKLLEKESLGNIHH